MNKRLTITVETPVARADAVDQCIDKISARRLVKVILIQCLTRTSEKCIFPMSAFATKADEETADATCALYYLEKNWDKCSKEGMKLLEKRSADQTQRDRSDKG
jgi:hypothetical protein